MRHFSAISSVLLCFSVVSLAHADETTAARQAIQALYNQIDAEDADGSFSGYLHHGTPDFTMIPLKGKPILREQIKPTKKKMGKGESITSSSSISSLILKGNEALVQVNHSSRVTFMIGQAQHALLDKGTAEDVWVKTGNIWRIKRTKMTQLKVAEEGAK